jgi:hypothetical protein
MTQILGNPNDTGEIARPIDAATVAAATDETSRIYLADQTAVITGAETTGVLYPDADIDLPLDEQSLRGALAETRRQVVIAGEGVVLDHTGGGRHEKRVRLVDEIVGLDDRPYPPVPKPIPPQPKPGAGGMTGPDRPTPAPLPAPGPPPAPLWAEPSAEYPPVLLRRSVPYVMPGDRPRGLGGLHRAPAPLWTRWAIAVGALLAASFGLPFVAWVVFW